MEAQRQELLALRGKVVVFVGAGSSPEKRSIYETAKELGVKSVVLDGPGSWADSMLQSGTVAGYYPVAFDPDTEVTLKNMLQAINLVRTDIGEPAGVCTFFEIAVPITTRLAAALGLPYNPIEAVDHARDKHATRRISAEAGLPTPKHASIESASDIDSAAATVGFPAVIKPISMFQSMGVLRVNSLSELRTAYDQVLAEVAHAQKAATGTNDYRATVANLGVKMVLEEFLDGDEQVIDLVFQDGECVYANVTDNWPATRSFETTQGKFNETGCNSPSILSKEQQNELMQLGIDTTKALGFKLGVLTLNMKYTSRGARLIEVNSRMGGMFIRDNNKLCWGVDLVEEHLLASCGIRCRPPKASAPLRAIAGVYVSAEVSGVVNDDAVLEEYAGSTNHGFLYFTPSVSVGSEVLGPEDATDFPTWLCGYMLEAPTVEEAVTRAQAVNDDVVARIGITAEKGKAAIVGVGRDNADGDTESGCSREAFGTSSDEESQ